MVHVLQPLSALSALSFCCHAGLDWCWHFVRDQTSVRRVDPSHVWKSPGRRNDSQTIHMQLSLPHRTCRAPPIRKQHKNSLRHQSQNVQALLPMKKPERVHTRQPSQEVFPVKPQRAHTHTHTHTPTWASPEHLFMSFLLVFQVPRRRKNDWKESLTPHCTFHISRLSFFLSCCGQLAAVQSLLFLFAPSPS